MPVQEINGKRIWQKRSTQERIISAILWLITLSIVAWCWSIISAQTEWSFVKDAPKQGADLINRMFPPKWSYLDGKLLKAVWDTMTIATLGTVLGLLLATPVAFFAARNTTPHPIFRYIALFIIVATRSIHSLVWALLLVFALGPGVFAGVIAIGVRSIGFIAKLLYEAIEEINPKQTEAITATGASSAQVLTYGVVPQIMPTFAGLSVFRWDINIRESTVIGLVGAGGIGQALIDSINAFKWSQASIIFIIIFILVLISEWVSAKARNAII